MLIAGIDVHQMLTRTSASIAAAVAIVSFIVAAIRFAHTVYRKISYIHNELLPNGGGSVKDAINRIEALQMVTLQITGKAFWLSDPEGNCTYASPKWATVMGAHPDQVIGMGWVSFISRDQRETIKKEWLSAVDDRREFHAEVDYIQPNGTKIPVTVHAIPVIHAQTKLVIGMIGWVDQTVKSS